MRNGESRTIAGGRDSTNLQPKDEAVLQIRRPSGKRSRERWRVFLALINRRLEHVVEEEKIFRGFQGRNRISPGNRGGRNSRYRTAPRFGWRRASNIR